MRTYLTFFLVMSGLFFSAQEKKTLQANLIQAAPKIDGILNEDSWLSANIATDFTEFRPNNGEKAPKKFKTDVRLLYDNEAIYIGAILYDDDPKKILREMGNRDRFVTADLFGVFINGYNDGQQEFRFFVTAAGVQLDAVATSNEDFSWDGVWNSKVSINDDGWVVEMKIPYSALRFPKNEVQEWGINFFREVKRNRTRYSWNYIDNNQGQITQYAGILKGIQHIKPPVRLALYPYASTYYTTKDGEDETDVKLSADIKYGINESFTLDAVLVPDFGQTAFDDIILNLGPFEQRFDENRPFFTEGLDLFEKGNLFYTRRVGNAPTGDAEILENEEETDSPSTVDLINALKISGRTEKGLGIGIFNGVTKKTYATLTDTITQQTRKELIEPLSNYNVLVLDQRFRKNSSVTLVNTNVTRNGHFRDANVTGLLFDLNTKENTYNLSGDFKYSYINDTENKTGYNTSLNFNETSGKYRYGAGFQMVSKDFDNNDLGINFETDYYDFNLYGNYRILKANETFNSFRLGSGIYTQFNKTSGKLMATNFNVFVNSTNKKFHYIGYGININPFKTYDFYEPRQENRYLKTPESYSFWTYISTNYNNRFAIDLNPFAGIMNEKGRGWIGMSIRPRYRFSDKLLLTYRFRYQNSQNGKGWVDELDDDTIIIANRDRNTFTNNITGKYSISNTMTVNLTFRHYWTYGEHDAFYALQEDGSLESHPTYDSNQDFTFNSWNVDLGYSWWFAPGSELSFLYRNAVFNDKEETIKDYNENLSQLFNEPMTHNFSIRLRYYLDYNKVKNWF
ncbi:hypothetical protein UJ101_00683 [Flavobacteriaceae bacterium UJ101]|nr:hypothetical protein UJ101_00683 [Flavobacteriaceae bacterium UJ101]